jgi:beta-lactamase class A
MTVSTPPVATESLIAWERTQAAISGAPASARIGVAVRHLDTGAVFAHHADESFPAASTVKLLILVGLARAVDEGRLRLDNVAPVLASQKVGGSGVLNWLTTGLELTLRDHAWLMIAISDNSASNVLIDAVSIDAIHDVQRTLGLTTTSLNRRFLGRLPAQGAPENVASAADLVTVLAAIDSGEAASAEQTAWMLEVLGDQQTTDRLARTLPDTVSFAGKSGWLTGISHDAGILRGPGGAVAVAVLTQGIADKVEASRFIGTIGQAVVEDLQIA